MLKNRDMDEDSEDRPVHFLSDRLSLSLKLVVPIIVFAIWLMRLSDKVDAQEARILRLERCASKSCFLGPVREE